MPLRDEPITLTEWHQGGYGHVLYGLASMQGWRRTMEDTHFVLLNMSPNSEIATSWFAVFDGHGGIILTCMQMGDSPVVGVEAANFAASNCHEIVRRQPAFGNDYVKALEQWVLDTDTAFEKSIKGSPDIWDPATETWVRFPGCTVIGILIEGNEGYVVCLLPYT